MMLRSLPTPAVEEQSQEIRAIAEKLDVLRKWALADRPMLTMTAMYNLMEKHREAIP